MPTKSSRIRASRTGFDVVRCRTADSSNSTVLQPLFPVWKKEKEGGLVTEYDLCRQTQYSREFSPMPQVSVIIREGDTAIMVELVILKICNVKI